jgi:pimeloyl-ACP methyl ester carboxylesterase
MYLKLNSFWLLSLLLSNISVYAQELTCTQEFSEVEPQYKTKSVSFGNSEASISGTIYSPIKDGNYPAIIVMPGGGSNVTNLRDVPVYLGKRAAACGIITLVYDKRGTGDSKGNYSEADFNDFIEDADAGVDLLKTLSIVDKQKIGAVGFSQGARLVANLAVRNKAISFIAGVSGPIYPVGLTRYYAFRNSLNRAQISDSTVAKILPFWEEHFNALETKDEIRSLKLDKAIQKASVVLNRNLLPPFYRDTERMPIYNSMGLDLLTELKELNVPWLSLYGEDDRIVPVQESINNIRAKMELSGNEDFIIEVIPNNSHSLYNEEESKNYPFEAEIIKWVLSLYQN